MGTYAVTGGASGIGAALVGSLREDGNDVIVIDLKDGDINADLTSEAGRDSAASELRALTPDGLDGLVPAAGLGGSGPPPGLVTALNYFGVVRLVDSVRDLVARRQGSIVLLCSNSVGMCPPEHPLVAACLEDDEAAAVQQAETQADGMHYMAGKRALAYWMRRNAFAYAREGIRMNAVAPGPTNTAMTKPLLEDDMMAKVMDALIDATPIQRMGEPSEIVQSIRFLLGDQSRYVCGSVLFVDGGYDAATRTDLV